MFIQQATDSGIKTTAKVNGPEVKVNHMQTSRQPPSFEELQHGVSEVQFKHGNIKLHHQNIDTVESEDLLKNCESASPDSRFQIIEKGVLPEGQLYPPVIPVK